MPSLLIFIFSSFIYFLPLFECLCLLPFLCIYSINNIVGNFFTHISVFCSLLFLVFLFSPSLPYFYFPCTCLQQMVSKYVFWSRFCPPAKLSKICAQHSITRSTEPGDRFQLQNQYILFTSFTLRSVSMFDRDCS